MRRWPHSDRSEESVESQQHHDFQGQTGKPFQHRTVRIIGLVPRLISRPYVRPIRRTKNQPVTSPPPSNPSPCRHGVGGKTQKLFIFLPLSSRASTHVQKLIVPHFTCASKAQIPTALPCSLLFPLLHWATPRGPHGLLDLPSRPLRLRREMYMRTKLIITSFLLALATSVAIAAPYCAVFTWGKSCDYNDLKDCLRAAGSHGECEINKREDKAPSGTAPFCLVTPQGTECIYDDAPACRMAASINTPAFANKVVCVANPDH